MSLISIIVPVYNVESFLPVCLDSLLKQTYSNLEIILVNDGSTDNSALLCRKYANKDERIVIINKANGGLSSARNSGLEVAKGEYLSFVDSDDYIHPDFIKNLYESLSDEKLSMCYFFKVDEQESAVFQDKVSESKKISSHDAAKKMSQIGNAEEYIVVWNKLYHRSLWAFIRFPEGRLHEDEAVMYKIYHQLDFISSQKTRLYYYRSRTGSIMSSKLIQSVTDKIVCMQDREAFYYSKGDYELANMAHVAHREMLLQNYIDNSFLPWRSYSLGDVIKDQLPLKLKIHLVIKKIFPIIYRLRIRLKNKSS